MKNIFKMSSKIVSENMGNFSLTKDNDMKIIKIIDLFIKIANGEEVPFLIKYEDTILKYDLEKQDYRKYQNGYLFAKLFAGKNSKFLNDKVEILEDEKKIPEKLSILTFSDLIDMPKEDLVDVIKEQRFKINSIIDYLKSKGDE